MRAQSGQVMAFIAVSLALVLMPLVAYAIDAATVSSAAAGLQEATATAAMEAAQQLDPIDFRSAGAIVVNGPAARSAARAVLAAEAPAASLSSLTITGAEVTIETGELIHLPFDFFPERSVRLEARASARLAAGYDRSSSRMPKVSPSDSSGVL